MRLYPLALIAVCGVTAALAVQACGDDATSADSPQSDGGGGGSETSTGRDSSTGGDDAATAGDGAVADATGCTPATPNLDAGGGCGTVEFGAIAAPFVLLDGGDALEGGTLAAGVYDAVRAEQLTAPKGSYRETFVVDGKGRFTVIRQIDNGKGAGPVTRRAGTYTVTGTNIKLTYDCAQSDGAFVDAGTVNFQFDTTSQGACGAEYRYSVFGILVTLKRR